MSNSQARLIWGNPVKCHAAAFGIVANAATYEDHRAGEIG